MHDIFIFPFSLDFYGQFPFNGKIDGKVCVCAEYIWFGINVVLTSHIIINEMFHKMLNIIIIHSLCCSFHNVVRFKCNAYKIKGQIEHWEKKANINIEWRKYRINKYYDCTKNKPRQKIQDIGRDVDKANPTFPTCQRATLHTAHGLTSPSELLIYFYFSINCATHT